ncbi:MAG TPA: hypothetical protein VI669_08890, partial [Vicinamibacteria bacterium]
FRLFTQAANLGDGQSQFNLGVFHRDGRGAPPDPTASFVWFLLAERAKIPQAAARADSMRQLLSPAQLAEAQRQLAQWSPRTP